MKLNNYLKILSENVKVENLIECNIKRLKEDEDDWDNEEIYKNESIFPIDSISKNSNVLKVSYPK